MCFGEDRRACNTKVCTISDDDDDDDSRTTGNSATNRHDTMTAADRNVLQQMEDNAADTESETDDTGDDDHNEQ